MVDAYSGSAGPQGSLGRVCEKGWQVSGVPCPVPSDLVCFQDSARRERNKKEQIGFGVGVWISG